MLSSEERQKANRRLAELCGVHIAGDPHVPNLFVIRLPEDAPDRYHEEPLVNLTTYENEAEAWHFVSLVLDFYAEDSGTWRERAKEAILRRIRKRGASWWAKIQVEDSHGYYCTIRGFDRDDIEPDFWAHSGCKESIQEAELAAILSALDALEKEGLGIPDEVEEP